MYHSPPLPSLLCQSLVRERAVVVLADLHCHSKGLGVFAYGCETSAVPAMLLKVGSTGVFLDTRRLFLSACY